MSGVTGPYGASYVNRQPMLRCNIGILCEVGILLPSLSLLYVQEKNHRLTLLHSASTKTGIISLKVMGDSWHSKGLVWFGSWFLRVSHVIKLQCCLNSFSK